MKKLLRCMMIAMILLLSAGIPVYAADTEEEPIPEPEPPVEISLSDTNITMIAGKSYTLELSGDVETVTWSSSKKSVAVVEPKKTQTRAKVTAKKAGRAVITAQVGEAECSCNVKVVAAKISAKKKTLYRGSTFRLTVKKGEVSKWESSNTSVATVGKKGKVTAKQKGTATITARIGVNSLKCKVTVVTTKWDDLQDKYLPKKKVKQLLFVKYLGGSNAEVVLYKKQSKKWKNILQCSGYVGSNGIDKQMEGDRRTPTGVFNLTSGFGIMDNPGTSLPYVKVTPYHYWCADPAYYNQLIDIRQHPHDCSGEHLIDYVPHYYYGAFLDYNKQCVYKKGAAIFLHCTGSNPYTAGCIAVSQSNMITILRNIEKGAKICIYWK